MVWAFGGDSRGQSVPTAAQAKLEFKRGLLYTMAR
jgi:hypothetical protein